MSEDSVSATISLSPRVSVVRYITQTLFLFTLGIIAAAAIIRNYGNNELWTMVLILCFSQILNLPMMAVVDMVKPRNDKTIKEVGDV